MTDEDLGRSIRSTHAVIVRFMNKTDKQVSVKWLNFSGDAIEYKQLEPKQEWSARTFVTHPWVFTDIQTRESLSVQAPGQKINVFEAYRFLQKLVNRVKIHHLNRMLKGQTEIGVRIVDNVYPPPAELRLLSMNLAKQVLEGRSLEQIQSLELPKILESEIVEELGLNILNPELLESE